MDKHCCGPRDRQGDLVCAYIRTGKLLAGSVQVQTWYKQTPVLCVIVQSYSFPLSAVLNSL